MGGRRRLSGRNRLLMAGAFFTVMVGFVGPSAFAGSTLITFTTSVNSGSRTLAETPPAFASSTDLTGSNAALATATSATTTVTEVLAAGVNPFSVTAQVCGPANLTTPAAVNGEDCTGLPNRLVALTAGAVTATISGSQITATNSNLTHLGTPQGTAANGATTTMTAPITLLSVTGESTSTAYNGVYANSTALSVANVYNAGTYYGYWITTLVT